MKLKQKLAIGLSSFYLFSIMGMALSMHFCSGKLADFSVFEKATSCSMCKDEPVEKTADNCCEDTQITAKVDNGHQMASALTLPSLFAVDVVLPYPVLNFTPSVIESVNSNFLNKAPPHQSKPGIVVLHQAFRI